MLDNSIYNIIKDLFGISEAKGFSEAEIEQVRDMRGKIPLALELYYREVGGESKINHTQNNLILPSEHTWLKSESHLIIYAENQGVCYWGISLDNLGIEDPPVYVTFDNVDLKTWELESYKVSDFLIAMAHVHAGFALPFGNDEEICMVSESGARVIRENFQKKCEPFNQWVGGSIEFFGNHPCDSIVLMRNASNYDLFYASGKESYYNEMKEILSPLGEAY